LAILVHMNPIFNMLYRSSKVGFLKMREQKQLHTCIKGFTCFC